MKSDDRVMFDIRLFEDTIGQFQSSTIPPLEFLDYFLGQKLTLTL